MMNMQFGRVRIAKTVGVAMVVAICSLATVSAQIKQGEVAGALYGGVNKYHGEFSDDMFAVSTGIGVSYAAVDRLLVEARFGLGEYRWKITEAKLRRFPGYFGQGADIGDRYPGTLTTIEGDNESRVTTADVMATWIIVPDIPASPFVSVGLGLFNFAPSNSEEHSALPNNLASAYPRTVVSIPVGGGVRIPLSSSVGLMLRGEHRFVFSPYLDDIKADHGNDALTTISLGLSYTFTAPPSVQEPQSVEVREVVRELRMLPPPSAPSCHRCGCMMQQMHGCCCHRSGTGDQPPMREPERAQPAAPAPAPEPEPTPEQPAAVEPTPAPTPEPTPEPAAQPEPTAPKKRKSFSKDIRFVVNTDEFDTTQPETEKNLQELLTYMQESCDDLQVMIEGHASADGPAERNRELSKLRAQRVQQWLIDQGVAPTKIRGAMGFGSSMPRVVEPSPAVAKTMTKDQLETIRRQNRRIEIAVLRDCKVQ